MRIDFYQIKDSKSFQNMDLYLSERNDVQEVCFGFT